MRLGIRSETMAAPAMSARQDPKQSTITQRSSSSIFFWVERQRTSRRPAARLPFINRAQRLGHHHHHHTKTNDHSKVQSRGSQPPSTVPHPNTVPVQRLAVALAAADRAPPTVLQALARSSTAQFQSPDDRLRYR
jgi:hypothetical protein